MTTGQFKADTDEVSTDELEKLLQKAQSIWEKDQTIKAEQLRRGERYNIFEVLGVERKEVRLHSAFIANLLNPKGSHGCGDTFLKLFVGYTLQKEHLFNPKKTKVCVEHYIGNKTNVDGGRIDILVVDNEQALIIENKIYAADQDKQLLRYNNYGKSLNKPYTLVYLSLFGTDASEESSWGVKNYIRLSYREHILKWLETCVREAYDKPLVRESLKQYIQTIKQLTYQNMDTQNIEELVELALDYPEAVAYIIENQSKISLGLREKYIFAPLERYAKERGLTYEKKWSKDAEPAILFKKETWNGHIVVGAENEFNLTKLQGKWVHLWVGIDAKHQENTQKLECLDRDSSSHPYGYSYLKVDNWHDTHNFAKMKQEVVKEIKEKIEAILRELENKNIQL